MKKILVLTVLTAVLLSILGSGCSDDPKMVNVAGMSLEYRHVDFEKLPQPVLDVINKVETLDYIIKGKFKGKEAYMYNSVYSSQIVGKTITSDGTEISFEEVNAAIKAGRLKNWVCIYCFKYDCNPVAPDSKK